MLQQTDHPVIIRAIIADDEPLAREGIRIRLENEPDFTVVDECETGTQTVEKIKKLKPDLVFLDIKMPGMNGFKVLQQIDRREVPVIVFITAFDSYAVQAFRVNALDYLLKPIDDMKFQNMLLRIRQQLKQKSLSEYAEHIQSLIKSSPNPDTSRTIQRIAIKERGKTIFIDVSDMDWIEAAGDYLYIHVNRHKYLIRQTLSEIQERLDPTRFQRIHRSTIVNLNRIQELQSQDHGDYHVILKDGTALKLSRSFRSTLEEALCTQH